MQFKQVILSTPLPKILPLSIASSFLPFTTPLSLFSKSILFARLSWLIIFFSVTSSSKFSIVFFLSSFINLSSLKFELSSIFLDWVSSSESPKLKEVSISINSIGINLSPNKLLFLKSKTVNKRMCENREIINPIEKSQFLNIIKFL